jgi:two-component system phosphate regulon sensor histidine kinase PhoR
MAQGWLILGFVAGVLVTSVWHRCRSSPKRSDPAPRFFHDLLDQAPIGYIQVDEENRLIYCNPCSVELLGVQVPDFIGKRKEPLLKWVRSYELDQLIGQVRGGSAPVVKDWVWQVVLPDPDNPAPQPSRALRGYGLHLSQGQVGIFLLDRQEVVQLQQQGDLWTADIAHELKTPLTAMRLVTETLQNKADGQLRPWLDRLLGEVLRLSELVQDLLELSQTYHGHKPSLRLEEIRLLEVVHGAWQILEPLAQKRQVRLECEIGPDCILRGDRDRLVRLFLNLLDNSIKHSPALQQILVTASLGDDRVVVDVIDCGQGFPPECVGRVFERFYRGAPSPCRFTSEQGGSGLGLAIAQQIVELHHGQIQAMNNQDTGGAQVRVILPLSPPNVKNAVVP